MDFNHFSINVANTDMDAFRKAWDRLVKRFRDSGLDEPVYIAHPSAEPVMVPGLPPLEATAIEFFCNPLVMIDGWQFVARLDHLVDGAVQSKPLIRRIIESIQIPDQFYQAGPDCGHCGHNRLRRDTFLLCKVDDPEEWIQVGSTCLKDFLKYDPSKVLKLFMALEGIQGLDVSLKYVSGHFSGGFSAWMIPLIPFLNCVQSVAEEYGWVSRKQAFENPHLVSTATRAIDFWESIIRPKYDPDFPSMSDEVHPWSENPEQVEPLGFMESALEWIQSKNTAGSEYLHNLQVVTSGKWIKSENVGLVASLYIAYKKEIDSKQLQHDLSSSEHFGEPGQRLEFVARLDMVRTLENLFGYSYMHRFITSTGNVAIWYASSPSDMEPGAAYQLRATVKPDKKDRYTGEVRKCAHTVFRGVKQTNLNRVVVIE